MANTAYQTWRLSVDNAPYKAYLLVSVGLKHSFCVKGIITKYLSFGLVPEMFASRHPARLLERALSMSG